MGTMYVNPKRSYHLAGNNAKIYAMWLMRQLPSGYVLCIGPDDLREQARREFPDRCIPELGQPVPTTYADNHKCLVMLHVDVDTTENLHNAIAEGDILYTLQNDSYIDIMPDIVTVDTQMELLNGNLHLVGSFDDVMSYVKASMPLVGYVYSVHVYNEEGTHTLKQVGNIGCALRVLQASSADEVSRLIAKYPDDFVWTWSTEKLDRITGPTAIVKRDYIVKYLE
ncbi:MAG: hypothetical protein NC548_11300 [Lachnospiraceae bacterium]|nr:hypothetical protein [Lachnospiraceae bacterium]